MVHSGVSIYKVVDMIPAGGLVRFSVNQTFQGQAVRNVFWYRAEDGVADDALLGIAQTFWEKVRTPWRAFAPNLSNLTFDAVEARAFDGDLDYAVYVIPVAEQVGTRSVGGSQFMPTFCAANITLNPANRQVRPGSKRIAGLVEVDNDANMLTTVSAGLLQTLANSFVGTIVSGGFIDTLTAVIHSPPTPDRPTRLLVPIVSASATRGITTQNSRKIGRGQ